MSKALRFFIGICIIFLIAYLGRFDVLLYREKSEAILLSAKMSAMTKRLSRSQLEYDFLSPAIQYEFEVNGRKFLGTGFYFNFNGWHDSNKTKNILASLIPGQKYSVWYDARDPGISWLFWSWDILFIGMLIFFGGLILMLSALPIKPNKIGKKNI
jgi:hypothetical protein